MVFTPAEFDPRSVQVLLSSCTYKICRGNWNLTHHIPVSAGLDRIHNGRQLVALDIRTGMHTHREIINKLEYLLPPAPAQAGQGRYKQMEAPPLLAAQLNNPQNHPRFGLSQLRFNKLNILCQQNAELTDLTRLGSG